MPQRAKGLTAAQVDKGTKPGRYGDGAGLYLLVRSRESKFWVFRYTRSGKMREMGLGPAVGRTAVSLVAARARARGSPSHTTRRCRGARSARSWGGCGRTAE